MFKRLVCFILCVSLAVCFSGCSGKNAVIMQKPFDSELIPSEPTESLIAENTGFTLAWNESTKGITLTEKSTGNTWGTSPKEPDVPKLDDWGDPITRHPRVDSVLLVEYMSADTGNTDSVISSTAVVKNGRVNCKEIENGIRVEHYFDEVEFMIPIDYTLRDDGVLLTIDPTQIQENENKIVSISVAPFWCAAENDINESYLFVPSGSGALIYPKSESQQGTNYSAFVYGQDPSIEVWDNPSTEKAVRLACYGVKTGNTATLAIIESGAESALINVTYGSKALGYSSVYASFNVRGYTNNIADLMPGERVKSLIYADNMVTTPLSVGFYPLTDDKADYSGMASLYKDYLSETAGMSENEESSPVNLNIIGGAMTLKSFLGVPYKTLISATTTDEVMEIVSKLDKQGIKPTVKLTGFGENGISVGKLAGGFKVASTLGGNKGMNELADYCDELGIKTYLDFDLINFSNGSGGFSAFSDSALCASRKIAYQYDFDIAVRGRNEDSRYRLLSRDSLIDCADKLFKKTSDLKISGYSLETLSNTAYSDYSDETSTYSYSKGNMAKDVAKILGNAKKPLLVSDANDYAAARADMIFDAPTSSSQADIFDEDIPFYEMVFKGRVSIACESINLSANPSNSILKAIESGCGLTYTVIGNYDKALLDIDTKYFYNSCFEDIYDDISDNASALSDYYEKIDGADISKHSILGNDLRCTEFSNGTVVYVNYGESEANTPFGNVPSGGYMIGGDGNAKN